MDLSSMLNDGPAGERKSDAPQSSPPARGNTIDHAPSTSASQARSRGLTPLQTPSQTPSQTFGGGQYPFPGPNQPQQPQHQQQHPAQSPISGPPYRPYDAYNAATPGARPPSQSFQFAQPSPSHYQPSLHAQQTMSMSPTPSSQHSHTPHSVRQSPMTAGMGHAPPQQQSYPPHFHHSQPSTPLGPPPPLIGRHSNQLDMSSPYHQRNHSGASNGMVAASPGGHNLSIGNLVESPSANYQRPSSARRSTSDYLSSAERDRSLSVSPKTKVPARQPSSGSRHSSQQESYSARSSVQLSASVAPQMGTQGRVPTAAPNYAPPPVNPALENSLSARNGSPNNHGPHPPALQHQPQKMDMHHLLGPTEHQQSQPSHHQNSHNSQSQSLLPQHQPPPTRLPQSQPSQHLDNKNPPVAAPPVRTPQQQPDPVQMAPLKRPAASPPAAEPPSKRGRRKYLERPIWAHLHKDNPRAKEPSVVPNSAQQAASTSAARTPQPQSQPHQNGQHMPLANGSGRADGPVDFDLARARRVLGADWERSMDGQVPITSLVKQVMDWLFISLDQNKDIGIHPREGTIEIEAKIGTLIDKRTGSRMVLPVTSAAVLDPRSNDNYQFESQMQEAAHRKMNEYLNRITKTASTTPGRKKIEYTHTRETDSFRTLNDAGLKLMPDSLLARNRRTDLRLRTSKRDIDGAVTARIAKVQLSQLQIYSPHDSYDVRISMNIEVNLDQPEIDTHDITHEPSNQYPAQAERKKDRVSYKHLTCQTDLTRVDTPGMPPKYELELELDANKLREQMALLMSSREIGFQAMVEGFMDNLTLLMRQPKQ